MMNLPQTVKLGTEGAVDLRQELEARLRAGDHRGVLEQASICLGMSDSDAADRAWVAVLACHAAGALREWGQAVLWAERGLSMPPGAEPEAMLNLMLGSALMYVGDPLRAERLLKRFQTSAPGTPRLERLLPDCLYNLGCLMRLLVRPAAEAGYFAEAAGAYAKAGRLRQELLCRVELACTHLLAESAAEALPELEAAQARMFAHGDPELDAYLQTCWALYYRVAGQLDRSQAACEELLCLPDLPAGTRAEVRWIMARNLRDMGRPSLASALIDAAYEDALAFWSPPQLMRIEQTRDLLQSRQVGR